MMMKNKINDWRSIEDSVHRIFFKEIIPIWLRERNNFQTFEEWELFCIRFNSFKFLPPAYHNSILRVFKSERNLNYEFFWMLNE